MNPAGHDGCSRRAARRGGELPREKGVARMVHQWQRQIRTALISALGVTILLGTPLIAQAEQGKWWKPKEGQKGQRQERGDQGWHRGQNRGDRGDRSGTWRDRGDRGDRSGAWREGKDRGDRSGTWRNRGDRSGTYRGGDRSGVYRDRGDRSGTWRGDRTTRDRVIVRDRVVRRPTYRPAPTYGGGGTVTYRDRGVYGRGSYGGYSTWRGLPVRRDVLVIRDRRYGGAYFRARRLFCAPSYYGRFIYVRPVRYFIAADACIGGLTIRASIVRPHYLYGCNFCDDRFDTYDAYCYHVSHCGHRPSGFEISVSNWDDGYDSYWDGPYQAADDDCDDCDREHDDEDEYYDE
jgi:hypothetical protein